MWRNYLTIAWRTLRTSIGYASINIVGLALGLACCLLIVLYVQDEFKYDQYHENADRMARVTMTILAEGETRRLVVTPSVVAPALQQDFPEVEQAIRLYLPGTYSPSIVRHGDVVFQESRFIYADAAFFDVFSFSFVAGDPAQAFSRPATVVLTETTADRYFGEANPIGQTLTVNNSRTFEVTGVVKDVPEHSHFHFDFVAPMQTLAGWSELDDRQVRAANFVTYALLRNPQDIDALQAKMEPFVDRMLAYAGAPFSVRLDVQRITDIRLYSNIEQSLEPQGDIRYIYAFGAIALLILLIACINYMNLATARALRRAKEVGIRKVLGAHRGQLIRQFYAEALLLTVLATVLGLIIVAVVLPLFNDVSLKSLTMGVLFSPSMLGAIIGVMVLVALVAGSYPALYLTGFQPASVLKGSVSAGRGGARLRQGLVVFQFAVSIFLIVGTFVIYAQMNYMQDTRLGFEKSQRVMVTLGDRETRQAYASLKQELATLPGVLNVGASSDRLGHVVGGYSMTVEGVPDDDGTSVIAMAIDEDFEQVVGLQRIAGPGIPDTYDGTQGVYHFMLNETAVERLGLTPEEAVGRGLNLNSREGTIVGVVADFHYRSLREEIFPLVLFTSPSNFDYLYVHVATDDIAGTIAAMEQRWKTLAPTVPFEFAFVDASFDALYRTEARLGQLFALFAVLAIAIACLGLFGLAAFTAERRTKEIGVRKVMGATVPQVVLLLIREFAVLIVIAFVLGLPLAFWGMTRWLENFAYQVDIGVGTLVLAGGIALLVAVGTVSYQAIKAALTDPARTLRYE